LQQGIFVLIVVVKCETGVTVTRASCAQPGARRRPPALRGRRRRRRASPVGRPAAGRPSLGPPRTRRCSLSSTPRPARPPSSPVRLKGARLYALGARDPLAAAVFALAGLGWERPPPRPLLDHPPLPAEEAFLLGSDGVFPDSQTSAPAACLAKRASERSQSTAASHQKLRPPDAPEKARPGGERERGNQFFLIGRAAHAAASSRIVQRRRSRS
jgi:hypothetical protein